MTTKQPEDDIEVGMRVVVGGFVVVVDVGETFLVVVVVVMVSTSVRIEVAIVVGRYVVGVPVIGRPDVGDDVIGMPPTTVGNDVGLVVVVVVNIVGRLDGADVVVVNVVGTRVVGIVVVGVDVGTYVGTIVVGLPVGYAVGEGVIGHGVIGLVSI